MQHLPGNLTIYFLSTPITCPAVQHHVIEPTLLALLRKGFKLDHEVRVWYVRALAVLYCMLTPSTGVSARWGWAYIHYGWALRVPCYQSSFAGVDCLS